jgi:hypothetical protein
MNPRLVKRIGLDYSRVLATIFEFMLSGGMQREGVMDSSARALRVAETRVRRGWKEDSGTLVTAALVLDAWHRDRRYLNSNAQPRAVRLLGPAPSVEALIRAERRRRDAADLARRLKSLRLVVSCGKSLYKPTTDTAVISAHDPIMLQHIARALSALLETIGHNLDSPPNSALLIERFAEVPDLPSEYVLAFNKFTQLQGSILLRTVNDWLESRRARRTRGASKATVRAGMHVHAYVAQIVDRSSSRRSVRATT